MKSELSLRVRAYIFSIALGIQFLLGMATNLFVQFPDSGGPGVMWEFAKTQPIFWAHLILGTLLVIGAIAFVVMAMRQKERVWKGVAWLGLLFIVLAWVCGEEFVSRQQDILSLSMAISFIFALMAYVWGIFRTKV